MSSKLLKSLITAVALTLVVSSSVNLGLSGRLVNPPDWIETAELRVIIRSTADWARLMFDDAEGRNSNGIRLKDVIGFGWLTGNDADDEIIVGKDLTYVDILYNATISRTGDIVSFFKGNNDFDYTEMYVDVILEVDSSKPMGYVFLMVAGQGVTTFQIVNRKTGVTIWRENVSGYGWTQHIKRTVPLEAFLREGRVESNFVVAMAVVAVAIVFLLNPIRLSLKVFKKSKVTH